jgi:hypothetical protein
MNSSTSRPDRPFLPEAERLDRSVLRAAVARAIASYTRGTDAEGVLRRTWPTDRSALRIVTKATVSPATTSTWGEPVAGAATAAFVTSLAPQSAAAKLITAGVRVSLDIGSQISVPYIGTGITPSFVEESKPIPVSLPIRGHNELGPTKELAAIVVITNELVRRGPLNAEVVISTMLREASAVSLDAAIFSDVAASVSRPAGILNGVTPLIADTSFDLDAGNLVDAIADAGGGGNIWLLAAPGRAVRLRLLAGAGLTLPVLGIPGLDPNTVIAIDVGGFASAVGEVEVTVGDQAVLHMSDTPAELVSGTGPTTAAPQRSMYQTDSRALRLILPAAWSMRAAGLVQVVTGVSW